LLRHKISANLTSNVKRHLKHEAKHGNSQNGDEKVLAHLPNILRRALLLETRGPIVKGALPFCCLKNVCPSGFERLCCSSLRLRWHAPDEQIFCFSEICRSMFFVDTGVFAYLRWSDSISSYLLRFRGAKPSAMSRQSSCKDPTARKQRDNTLAHIEEGDAGQSRYIYVRYGRVVCEPVLWCCWQHRGDLNALTYSSVLELAFRDFEQLSTRYPQIKAIGHQHCQTFVDALNDKSRSDLFDSRCVYDGQRRVSRISSAEMTSAKCLLSEAGR